MKNLMNLGMIVLLAGAGAARAQNFEAEASWDATSLTQRAKSGRDHAEAEISAMKTASRAVDAPAEDGSENFSGLLTISPGPETGKLPLHDGRVGLRFGKPDSSGFFSDDRSVSLAQGSRMMTFPVKNSAFNSFGDFATDGGFARFALRGAKASKQLAQSERDARVSCSHTGYCYGCGLGFNGKFDCSFKLQSCGGIQSVRQRVTDFETVTTVEILSRETGRAVGAIKGEPVASETVENIANLSTCN